MKGVINPVETGKARWSIFVPAGTPMQQSVDFINGSARARV